MTINPYDKAHEFARAVRDSEAFQRYAAANRSLQADEEATQQMMSFRQLQLEVNQAQMLGEEVSETQSTHLNLTYKKIMENPLISEFMTAENGFVRLFSDLQNVIQKDIETALAAE